MAANAAAIRFSGIDAEDHRHGGKWTAEWHGAHARQIEMADDPVAGDATCAWLMGLQPERIMHVREGARLLGNAQLEHIDQLGESVTPTEVPFNLVPQFQYLQAQR